VRDDSITLGIGVSDLGAVGALGPGYDQGDPVQHIEAILAQLREEGRLPVHGRDIEPVYRSYSVISKDEQRAACEHLAIDVEVFAIMALTHFGQGNECAAREHGIPTLTSDGQADAVYERSAPNLRSLQVSAGRLLRNFAAWADRGGLLDGKRIGVSHLADAESVELVQANVLDQLEARGHDVVVTVQTSETTGGPTDSVAVQRFATNCVDLAILLVSPIAKTNFFVQAQAQRYRPTYIENDYASSTTDTGASTYAAEHFDGTRGVTMVRYGEASAGLEEGERARWCRDAIRRHAGRDISREGRDAEYISSNESCRSLGRRHAAAGAAVERRVPVLAGDGELPAAAERLSRLRPAGRRRAPWRPRPPTRRPARCGRSRWCAAGG